MLLVKLIDSAWFVVEHGLVWVAKRMERRRLKL